MKFLQQKIITQKELFFYRWFSLVQGHHKVPNFDEKVLKIEHTVTQDHTEIAPNLPDYKGKMSKDFTAIDFILPKFGTVFMSVSLITWISLGKKRMICPPARDLSLTLYLRLVVIVIEVQAE